MEIAHQHSLHRATTPHPGQKKTGPRRGAAPFYCCVLWLSLSRPGVDMFEWDFNGIQWDLYIGIYFGISRDYSWKEVVPSDYLT